MKRCSDCDDELFGGGRVCSACGAPLCWVCAISTVDGEMCRECSRDTEGRNEAEEEALDVVV